MVTLFERLIVEEAGHLRHRQRVVVDRTCHVLLVSSEFVPDLNVQLLDKSFGGHAAAPQQLRQCAGQVWAGCNVPGAPTVGMPRSIAGRAGADRLLLPRVATAGAVEREQSAVGVQVVRGGVGDDHVGHIAGTRPGLRFIRH